MYYTNFLSLISEPDDMKPNVPRTWYKVVTERKRIVSALLEKRKRRITENMTYMDKNLHITMRIRLEMHTS
jgi:hypothetical protein